MSTATLADIITKIRLITGSANTLQLTDDTIIDRLNSFYLYDFPAQFRSLQLKNTYTLNTIQNIDTYPFDFVHYSTLENPARVDNRAVPLYNNPWPFYSLFFNWKNREVFATGDGTAGAPYTGTLLDAPISRSYNNNPMVETKTSNVTAFTTGQYPTKFENEPNIARVQNIIISANTTTGTENVTDDGNGNLIGATGVSGTIDYVTGAITVTFANNIPSGEDINIAYQPANASIPQAILFYQNQLTLRPTPDRGYTVEITAYRRPSQVLLGTVDSEKPDTSGVPELLEWWETLVAGASKKIFEDRSDADGIALMDKMLAERYDLNETRTYAQLGKQRIGTLFSDQISGTSDGGYFGFGGQNSG